MKVWNIDEAAEFLRISAYTLRGLVRAGKVPGAKVGGEWRFTDESLENYVRKLIEGDKPAEPAAPKTTRRPRMPPPLIKGLHQ